MWLPQSKKVKDFVIATIEFVLGNTELKFAYLSGKPAFDELKHVIGLKITLVKFKYPKG